ncbi:hypothetical protein VTI74DRAFT_743 [Chaetomium olivicolor]
MFVLVVASNIGLALQKSYLALFVLRMVQSAGASGSYGAAHGIVADVTTVAERGGYVGTLIFFAGGAPSFGPVIAGVLTGKLGWRWIFWFLIILTGAYLIVVVLLLPETQWKVVGNGSIPAKGIHKSLFDALTRNRTCVGDQQAGGREATKKRKSCHFPNLFKCIPMFFKKGNLTVILIGFITYTVKMVLQSSHPAQCIEIYQLDYLQAGLIYLPSGVGGAIASYSTGKFQLSSFVLKPNAAMSCRQHIAAPLVLQFITGAATSSIFLCGTLITDLNPHASARSSQVERGAAVVILTVDDARVVVQQQLGNIQGAATMCSAALLLLPVDPCCLI